MQLITHTEQLVILIKGNINIQSIVYRICDTVLLNMIKSKHDNE